MATLKVDIVTPSRQVLSETCSEVLLPSFAGEIGVLPEHAALVSEVGCGVVRLKAGEKSHALAVRGGFVQVADNQVTLLADQAALPSEVQKGKLEERIRQIDAGLISADVPVKARKELLDERDWVTAQQALL